MIQTVPLIPAKSQNLTITLGGQICQINVYQKLYGVFIDLYVGTGLIIGGVYCLNKVRIVRDSYLGFVGDLAFVDTQENDKPFWQGLGSRFILTYLAEADLAILGIA